MQINSLKISDINFTSSADISLEYVLKNHNHFLPNRMKTKIENLLASGKKELPQLYELHAKVYQPLMNAKTLDEAKSIYPEYSDVIELSVLKNNRSKAIKAIRAKGIPFETFTLNLLKKLYRPSTQEELVKEYNFTNRNLMAWLLKKLNIQKLQGNYINLLRMSNETENTRIANLSRQAIYANPEIQAARQLKATEHHRSKSYRTKKRQEMINFYKQNPDRAEKVRLISKLTWEKCPEIKKALSAFTSETSDFTKNALRKRQQKKALSNTEQKAIQSYYKAFWSKHPEMKDIYSKMRIEAAKEINSCLI